MFKSLSLLFLATCVTAGLLAQDVDKNIVIKNAQEDYRFVKGNGTNPVQVKQRLQTTYFCNDYRTSLPIVEFYNDQVQLNDVDARVDGDKVKNFKPGYDYYS